MSNPLEITSLTAGYKTRRQQLEIVQNLNARLRPGEFACLLGVNGAGKSTLLRTVANLQPKLAGEVRFDGVVAERMSRGQLARTLALVLTHRVYGRHLTGLDVIRIGRHPYTGWGGRFAKADHDAVSEAIELTGCHDLTHRAIDSMSDGERQRIMIARAVAQRPRVMLLDEPTAFLDITHRLRLTALLRDLTHTQSIAVLMSTHDLDLALRTADTVWLVQPTGSLTIAAPEDIALSGILSSEFSDDRLVFDDKFGGFRITPPSDLGEVRVAGPDEITRLWTVRALSRVGFTPIATGGAGGDADVTVSDGRWQTRSGETVASIGDLVDRLTHADHEKEPKS